MIVDGLDFLFNVLYQEKEKKGESFYIHKVCMGTKFAWAPLGVVILPLFIDIMKDIIWTMRQSILPYLVFIH